MPIFHRRFWLRELPILVIVALLLSFVLQTFIARVYVIPSESMEPTLHGCVGCAGDRIAVDKLTYLSRDPEVGEIVVFRAPTSSWDARYESSRSDNSAIRTVENLGALIGLVAPDENDLVKRVIATGGQTVECCDAHGRTKVDGIPLDEPYVATDFGFAFRDRTCTTEVRSGRCFGPVTVPEGSLWMMGDNRNHSADSRAHIADELNGTVPIDHVIGKVRLIVLPMARWRAL